MKAIFTVIFLISITILSCNSNPEQKIIYVDSSKINKAETVYVKSASAIETIAPSQNEVKNIQPATGGGKAIDIYDSANVTIDDGSNTFTEMDMIGIWKITMEVKETNCQGVVNGDIKTETWKISKTGGKMRVKVSENDNTNTSYEGDFYDGKLDLQADHNGLLDRATTSVHVGVTKKNHFIGYREILISIPCRSVYKISGDKIN